jgi:serine/threonine-protein kinase
VNTCPTCGKQYPPGTRLCPDDGGVLEDAETVEERRVGNVVAGKYRLEGFLSRGGMGAVYRATHVMLGKPCVVKVIRPDLVTSPELVRRFLREARAAAGLSHPNIVIVFDLGEAEDGTLYIAMELVQGRSLHDVIRQEGRIAPSRTVHLLRQVASALAQAHRQHIVHRDLKPQNLMVTRDSEGRETVKLLDFGIAKTFDENTELTATGLTLGTPQYMAPEQVMGGAIDHRTDLYALGVILYQMLIGEVPFTATSAPALLMKHVNDVPDPPSRRRPDLHIPAGLEAVALRCLEKEPARRFQSADEFGAALERAVADDASEAATIRLGDAATIPMSRPSESHPTTAPSRAATPAAPAAATTPAAPAAATPPAVPGGAPEPSTRWRAPAAGIAAIVVVSLLAWALGLFRTSAPPTGQPLPEQAGVAAPRETPQAIAAATPVPTAGGTDSPTPVPTRAASQPPPAVPSVWVQCVGAQEVCSPLSLAFELTIESERLPAADRADGAEIALTIRATAAQDREQKPGGLMWEQIYSVGVEGRAPRFGAAVPMPPPRTLNFDSYFGRDAAMDIGRAMAKEAVARIRDFWTTRVTR